MTGWEALKLYMRRIVLSRGALLWFVQKVTGSYRAKSKSFESWNFRDVSTYIYYSLKFKNHWRFLSVITVNGLARTIIIIPENNFNGGWALLLLKLIISLIEVQGCMGLHLFLETASLSILKGKGASRKLYT